ncbi:MAG: 4-carboxy-4-hydroxy-2-oxoadipate aldolase/oxaloacetate decarboxylase [Lachnospiraceae bacterium]|nr:4-carboxy-4-hydroxy-2-oxoadipate aldolase/oxaloacetate decarboxylase [Lachnospiraceae bacterium]
MKAVNLDFKKPDKSIVEQFRNVSVATAHEAMGRKNYIDPQIRQLYPGMKICGTAITCECHEMDNITLHAALHIAGEGDVIVCTMGDYTEQGPFGDCMATCAKSKGINGLVIDSGVRDGETIKEIGFPVFSKGHCINGTVKSEFGTVNHPIAFGGQVVNPGDIIIGDDDGVVVVPKEIAAEVLEASLKRLENEEKIRATFLSGVDSWIFSGFGEKLKARGIDIGI